MDLSLIVVIALLVVVGAVAVTGLAIGVVNAGDTTCSCPTQTSIPGGADGPVGGIGEPGPTGASGPPGATGPPGAAAPAVEYLFGANVGTMAGVGTDTDITEFKTTLYSNGLTLTNGVIGTLKAGKTYELNAFLYCRLFSNATNGSLLYTWVDSVTNARLNTFPQAASGPTTQASTENYAPYAMQVYTPTVDQSVKLRTTAALGTCTIDFAPSWIKVVEIPT